MSDNPPDPIEYQGYTANTTTEEAERAFTIKYGHPPRVVVKQPGAVLAGPIHPLVADHSPPLPSKGPNHAHLVR